MQCEYRGKEMLTIILDIGCGYLVARYVNHIWIALLASLTGGAVIAIGANILLYASASDASAADEIMKRIASGVILHPLVILVALLLFRRRRNGAPSNQ